MWRHYIVILLSPHSNGISRIQVGGFGNVISLEETLGSSFQISEDLPISPLICWASSFENGLSCFSKRPMNTVYSPSRWHRVFAYQWQRGQLFKAPNITMLYVRYVVWPKQSSIKVYLTSETAGMDVRPHAKICSWSNSTNPANAWSSISESGQSVIHIIWN